MSSSSHSNRVLLPVVGTEALRPFLTFGRATFADADEVVLLGIVVASGEAGQDAHRARTLRRRLRQYARDGGPANTRIVVRTAQSVPQAVRASVLEEQPDLILVPWTGSSSDSDGLDELAVRPPCDAAFIRPVRDSGTSKVLLAARGGPQAELAMRLALMLARRGDAQLTLMHIDRPSAEEEDRRREHKLFATLVARCRKQTPVKQRTIKADDVAATVLAEASQHDVLVLGAGMARGADPALGNVADRIAREADCTAVVVKSGTPVDPAFFSGPRTPIEVVVDRWFADNTFHCREFEDIESLVAAKRRSGLTVSLAVMAREDREALRGIVEAVTAELVDRNSLLDEVLVFDQEGSVVEPPFRPADRPSNGASRKAAGSGFAIRKSIERMRSDVLVWIDGDLRNVHSRMVYGVVGPLVTQTRLQYVKGFYQRPATTDDASFSQGRAQLTELTARPLLNVFFPELSGVVAPLAREHAIRRSALEGIRLFAGQGVEVGLLIDVLQRHGLRSIAQADLESRVGEDLSVSNLTEQAFSVVQVILRRLRRDQSLRRPSDKQTMKLILQQEERYRLELVEAAEAELPAIPRGTSAAAIN